MGGEKVWSKDEKGNKKGSPPRGRGKVTPSLNDNPGLGITPAWAGKRCGLLPFCGLVRDHPRVGGEKGSPSWIATATRGSPPRGRGKALLYHTSEGFSRITPAWAGKSLHLPCISLMLWDHPRVGGEKSMMVPHTVTLLGSPPRGRGKVEVLPPLSLGGRITPAWAGKSKAAAWWVLRCGDHPRVGGEKERWKRLHQRVKGSPPRGRGKAVKASSLGPDGGITPAWAGKRRSWIPGRR